MESSSIRTNSNSRRALVALACVVGCSSSSTPPPSTCGDAGSGPALFVLATDASSSAIGTLRGEASLLTTAADLGKDPVLSVSAGRIFVLARDLDAVFEFDAACGRPLSKHSTGVHAGKGSTNPQDVAVAKDGTLWIPKYNVPELAILRGDTLEQTIDLAPYDPDGNPQAAAIVTATVSGVEKAFVTLQRLDPSSKPTQTSVVLRIDTTTRKVDGQLELKTRNPFTRWIASGDAFYLASPGDFFRVDEPLAGIEVFDPTTFSSRLLVSELALGGSVAQVAVDGDCGAAIVADPSSKTRTALVTFDARTGKALSTYANPVFGPSQGYHYWALRWLGDTLYLGDRERAEKGYPVHRFKRQGTSGCALVREMPSYVVSQMPAAFAPLK